MSSAAFQVVTAAATTDGSLTLTSSSRRRTGMPMTYARWGGLNSTLRIGRPAPFTSQYQDSKVIGKRVTRYRPQSVASFRPLAEYTTARMARTTTSG